MSLIPTEIHQSIPSTGSGIRDRCFLLDGRISSAPIALRSRVYYNYADAHMRPILGNPGSKLQKIGTAKLELKWAQQSRLRREFSGGAESDFSRVAAAVPSLKTRTWGPGACYNAAQNGHRAEALDCDPRWSMGKQIADV